MYNELVKKFLWLKDWLKLRLMQGLRNVWKPICSRQQIFLQYSKVEKSRRAVGGCGWW